MSNSRLFSAAVLLFSTIAFLSGCAGQQSNTKSSVMDYLYPKSNSKHVEPSIPHLNLPLKVGIAFVPDSKSNTTMNNPWAGRVSGGSLTASMKSELLDKVADSFRELDYVGSIDVIPSAYLTPGGSFANLEQIKTMYGIDTIALVSYDQVQFTDEGALSLSYWTIVGAYIVTGEKNDTSTLMDTVVYDIASKKLLFRAPGISRVRGTATPVNLSEALREDSNEGFKQATNEMIVNLKDELTRFEETVKKDPQMVTITHKPGYTPKAGATGLMDLLFLLSIALIVWQRNNLKAVFGNRIAAVNRS